MATHVVTALQLNLRSAPDPDRRNQIATLAQGTPIMKIADAARPRWWEVETELAGQVLRGFLNSDFVAPIGTVPPVVVPPAAHGRLPSADLPPSSSARRDGEGGRASPIGEASRPPRATNHPGGVAAGIVRVIEYLDPGDADHVRWKPGQYTFCNVYAYDVCNMAGCYLPRVWWTGTAIRDLLAGRSVAVQYGQTVNEMRANYLHDWLQEYGADFGWTRVFDLDTLQDHANDGRIGLICAQRVQMERPGHIQVVAPEAADGTRSAERRGGKVVQPVQSQAGARNFTFGFLGRDWWRAAQFRQFGFWTAAPTP